MQDLILLKRRPNSWIPKTPTKAGGVKQIKNIANLDTFEKAYETFFFAYGFELLKEIDENYTFELKGKYADNEEYISKMTNIYNDLQLTLMAKKN